MTTQRLIERKNYWSLDIAKFFCAIFIISASVEFVRQKIYRLFINTKLYLKIYEKISLSKVVKLINKEN